MPNIFAENLHPQGPSPVDTNQYRGRLGADVSIPRLKKKGCLYVIRGNKAWRAFPIRGFWLNVDFTTARPRFRNEELRSTGARSGILKICALCLRRPVEELQWSSCRVMRHGHGEYHCVRIKRFPTNSDIQHSPSWDPGSILILLLKLK